MLKRAIAILVSLIFVFSFTALSFAAEKAATPAAPVKADEKKAAPAMEQKKAPVKVKQVTGDVAAVDAKANTITVKGKKGDVTVACDAKTKMMMGKEAKTLADIKVGDKVTVKYTESDGKMTAKSIAIKTAGKKAEPAKVEKKAEPTKPVEKK